MSVIYYLNFKNQQIRLLFILLLELVDFLLPDIVIYSQVVFHVEKGTVPFSTLIGNVPATHYSFCFFIGPDFAAQQHFVKDVIIHLFLK